MVCLTDTTDTDRRVFPGCSAFRFENLNFVMFGSHPPNRDPASPIHPSMNALPKPPSESKPNASRDSWFSRRPTIECMQNERLASFLGKQVHTKERGLVLPSSSPAFGCITKNFSEGKSRPAAGPNGDLSTFGGAIPDSNGSESFFSRRCGTGCATLSCHKDDEVARCVRGQVSEMKK